MIEDRRRYECPKCHCKILYIEGKEVCCAGTTCNWKGIAKRVEDHKLSTMGEIKNAWGLG